MDNKKNLPMNESMFSAIDQIRQDSKDVRDFVKNVFADREFKKMSNDKDFIKYLKSIYEGTMIDEEHVKFSNRTQNGTISTGSVQTTNESVNEAASKEAMGIAGFTGTRGIAVQKFIDDYNLDSKKLFNFVKKGKLKDRLAFVTAIAGKPGNKHQGDIVGMFGESTDGVPQGYNPMVEDTQEIKNLLKKVGNKETKFYDVLNTIEKKYGKNKYRIWLEKSLKSFGTNPKHYKRHHQGTH